MGPHSDLGKYRIVSKLAGLHNIRKGPHNTIKAERTFRKIPEGMLFVQTDGSINWKENRGEFNATVHLYPAFYNTRKAWLLCAVYGFEGTLEQEEIITLEEGEKLYSMHQ